MIESQPVRHAAAAIVSDQREFLKSPAGHHIHLVLGHGAFGIIHMVFAVGRLAAVTVAAKIGGHHRELLGQPGSDVPPFDVRLWIAV